MELYSFNITSDPISEGSDANRVSSYGESAKIDEAERVKDDTERKNNKDEREKVEAENV